MARKPAGSQKTKSEVVDLRTIRLRAGISLEQVADKTKISTRFLQAIEAEEFDKLPGGIFNTSYIRQYAGAIGYSEEKLLALYRSKMGVDESGQEVRSGPAPKRAAGRFRLWSPLERFLT